MHHPRLSELLEQRDNAADQVPEFWSDAICRHPRMAALLTSEDMKALVYLTRVEVQEVGDFLKVITPEISRNS